RESPGAGRIQPQFSAGVSGDRGAGGAAAPALPLRGSALQVSAAHHGAFVHHAREIALLHRACTVGGLRKRAQVRAQAAYVPAGGTGVGRLEMDRLLNVTAGLSVVLLIVVLASVRRAHIRVEYSVSWLLAAVSMLVLSRSYAVLEVVRKWS